MNQIPGTSTVNQMTALVWIPRVTASLSSLGSLAIIYMIMSARKEKLTKSNHRLMLGLSICDAIHSTVYATTTLASPRDLKFYGAAGNAGTCNAQGFMIIFGVATPMYNMALNLFFLSSIRYRIPLSTFSTKIEPFLHTISIMVPLTLAIVSISIDGIRSEGVVCYLSLETADTVWAFIIATIGLCFIINLYSMISIYRHVVTRLNKVRRYSYCTTQNERRDAEKRDVLVQSLFYTGAFFLTYLWSFIITLFNKQCFFLLACNEIFYPLQGFWNFLLYIRPIVMRLKKTYPDKSWTCVFWETIFQANRINGPSPLNGCTNRGLSTINIGLASPISLPANQKKMLAALAHDSEEMEENATRQCEVSKNEGCIESLPTGSTKEEEHVLSRV